VQPVATMAAPKPPCASGTWKKTHGARMGAVLVFWPRTRRTFLPADAVPQMPDGANEPREGDDEEGEEDEELGGVEGSRRALFGD